MLIRHVQEVLMLTPVQVKHIKERKEITSSEEDFKFKGNNPPKPSHHFICASCMIVEPSISVQCQPFLDSSLYQINCDCHVYMIAWFSFFFGIVW